MDSPWVIGVPELLRESFGGGPAGLGSRTLTWCSWGGLAWHHPLVETSRRGGGMWSTCWWLGSDYLGAEMAVEAGGRGNPIPALQRPHNGLPTGLRPLQTPPPGPGPGAGSVLSAVKVEDSWPQGPPEPTSCQLGKRPHGPSAASSPRNVRDSTPAQVRVPSWGPAAQGEAWARLLKSSRVGFSAPTKVLPAHREGAPGCLMGGQRYPPGLPSQAVVVVVV